MKTRISLLVIAAAVLAIGAGCEGQSPQGTRLITLPPPVPLGELLPRNRYKFNHDCVVIKSASTGNFLTSSGSGYAATVEEIADAAAFYMMPSALGEYVIYNADRNLISGTPPLAGTGLSTTALDDADSNNGNDNIFVVKVDGDSTDYPMKPIFVPEPRLPREEPSLEWTTEYHTFEDPNLEDTRFTFVSLATGNALTAGGDGLLSSAAFTGDDNQVLIPQSVDKASCQEFPEASSNTVGETFKDTHGADNRVLGMVDSHVHISSTVFLGKAQWGSPFHPFGVAHALDDCDEYHGPTGSASAVEAGFSQTAEHDVTGWPTFPDWPAQNNLFHEAIYWKWVERAWKSGLRIAVNDLVDNETLCEISRNAAQDPTLDCNSMNNAGRQAYTMWAMQDYIDAQYGGRGEGFFRIALSADEARQHIVDGNLAVIIGIEISNLADCKVNYSPPANRTEEPFQETGDGGSAGTENSYSPECTAESLRLSMDRMWGWGVRQVITIHEFDNAFGGNGIFDGLILNAGNRENSGGIPGGALSGAGSAEAPSGPPEVASGEFWTTYSCPSANDTEWPRGPDDSSPAELFDGWIFDPKETAGGSAMASPGTCFYTGQGPSSDPTKKRPGGSTPCYPAATQCNARWLTPRGLEFYALLMEYGMIFDIDHLAVKMKSQALDLAEMQTPAYPFVSTHGTFGGITRHQARRMLTNGGLIYPSIGRTFSSDPDDFEFLDQMDEMKELWREAGSPGVFGFGFGTDTNGLSAQTRARKGATEQISYPYTLFDGGVWDTVPEFNKLTPVIFEQPEVRDVVSGQGRTWHIDSDGSAHYGMMSGNVQEIVIEGSDEQLLDLFTAAERYLQMWKLTEESRDAIVGQDGQGTIDTESIRDDILKQAPVPDSSFSVGAPSEG